MLRLENDKAEYRKGTGPLNGLQKARVSVLAANHYGDCLRRVADVRFRPVADIGLAWQAQHLLR